MQSEHPDLAHHESAPAVTVRDLSVAYRNNVALQHANLSVPTGSVFGIVGPNGAGKSTLLNGILGLIPTLHGSVKFFDQPLRRVRKRVGYMPQNTSVDWDFPTTVKDVVLMGTYQRLGWFRRPGSAEKDIAGAAMERTGVADLAKRQIGQLSGGQRQRVFLARTLAQEADIVLLDEPFAGVDARTQAAIIDVLHGLRDEGKTVVMVHHDLGTIPQYCDHVALLNGTVLAAGPVETTFTDANVTQTFQTQP
ncbi:metal ABC transporter ATP-binding protein [Micrococcoides hystricis]|uniref:Metal ABC transporter ATP-binding protein n=1 Tax=Micrococcoides hystricis TaxID=1572761 RepID=A0ABV6PD25_9MICC